ncbi:hypothetical protein Micbo1qcDRAFT_237136 [Microdochium bolleyi]|uniref:Uncharacterized protein n=1 Tax=Microdochium bolleyi TaxID=196109 RepID=A0A136INI1_9PEZI|nr:hypothetical protein Micbo1qcDRAFT_237136 [Microdochium bolleyi]
MGFFKRLAAVPLVSPARTREEIAQDHARILEAHLIEQAQKQVRREQRGREKKQQRKQSKGEYRRLKTREPTQELQLQLTSLLEETYQIGLCHPQELSSRGSNSSQGTYASSVDSLSSLLSSSSSSSSNNSEFIHRKLGLLPLEHAYDDVGDEEEEQEQIEHLSSTLVGGSPPIYPSSTSATTATSASSSSVRSAPVPGFTFVSATASHSDGRLKTACSSTCSTLHGRRRVLRERIQAWSARQVYQHQNNRARREANRHGGRRYHSYRAGTYPVGPARETRTTLEIWREERRAAQHRYITNKTSPRRGSEDLAELRRCVGRVCRKVEGTMLEPVAALVARIARGGRGKWTRKQAQLKQRVAREQQERSALRQVREAAPVRPWRQPEALGLGLGLGTVAMSQPAVAPPVFAAD